MKQGRASRDVRESTPVNVPKINPFRPAGVSQIGTAKGTHATGEGDNMRKPFEKLHAERGFVGPAGSRDKPRNGGSQGRY